MFPNMNQQFFPNYYLDPTQVAPGAPPPDSATPDGSQSLFQRMRGGLDKSLNDPLMGIAAAILNASGPTRMPVSTGQVLGAGFVGGQRVAQQNRDNALREGLLNARMTAALNKNQPLNIRQIANGNYLDTVRFNPDGTQTLISRAPRFKNDPMTMGGVIAPILNKISNGQPLTDGEQRALTEYQHANPLDRLLSQYFPGAGIPPSGGSASDNPAPQTPIPQPTSSVSTPKPPSGIAAGSPPSSNSSGSQSGPSKARVTGMTAQVYIQQAKAAIQQGANPAAVRQRLQNLGVDPSQAGL